MTGPRPHHLVLMLIAQRLAGSGQRQDAGTLPPLQRPEGLEGLLALIHSDHLDFHRRCGGRSQGHLGLAGEDPGYQHSQKGKREGDDRDLDEGITSGSLSRRCSGGGSSHTAASPVNGVSSMLTSTY
jgi:hypothetical protein